jgi:cytochrome c-type biogenesis protein CcsB
LNAQAVFFYLCAGSLGIAIITSLIPLFQRKKKAVVDPGQPAGAVRKSRFHGLERAAIWFTVFSFVFISAFIVARIIATGHGPFTSMYEFAVAFVWGILLMGLLFTMRYRNLVINLAGMVICAILLAYAGSLSAEASPLVPALQNSFLLSAHVASAVIAYGAFTIGFATSVFMIMQKNNRFAFLPESSVLESISYHAVIIGFPFMTLVIVLGALWADIAWGRYWGWDPKETASLVTWLIYAGYLHTRIMRGWRGRKTAILMIIGFVAVILTFFGNYIFNGLHAYG